MTLLPGPEESGPDTFEVSEVIRPAAILSEQAARVILRALEDDDVRRGGRWYAVPGTWQRWDLPWATVDDPGDATLLGAISCVYDQPRRYSITVFRASITLAGAHQAWTVDRLCDEAFGHAGLSLADAPRADLAPPPPPLRYR